MNMGRTLWCCTFEHDIKDFRHQDQNYNHVELTVCKSMSKWKRWKKGRTIKNEKSKSDQMLPSFSNDMNSVFEIDFRFWKKKKYIQRSLNISIFIVVSRTSLLKMSMVLSKKEKILVEIAKNIIPRNKFIYEKSNHSKNFTAFDV